MYGNFTQDQLTLLVNSEYVAVKKLGNLRRDFHMNSLPLL